MVKVQKELILNAKYYLFVRLIQLLVK